MRVSERGSARRLRGCAGASWLTLALAGLAGAQEPEQLERREGRRAPSEWRDEAFQRRALERLRSLERRFAERSFPVEALEELVAPDFAGDRLAPEASPETGREPLELRRRGAPGRADEPELRGADGLAAELARWAACFDAEPRPVLELAVERVEGVAPRRAAILRVGARGRAGEAALQHDALWRCEWEDDGDGRPPRLARLRVLALDAVRAAPGAPRFVDCAPSAFDGEGVYTEQLLPGLVRWQERLDANLGVSFLGHQGLALGDVDGDGLEDLYLCQPGGLPNRLFLRRADGTAREAAAEAGVDFLDPTASALLVDLDGDGDLDLVSTIGEELLFLANDGEGRFQPRGSFPAPMTMSLAAADVDGDGDLDVYLCGYVSPYSDEATPVPYHDANNGAPNRMLLNEGGFRFRNATAELGLDENNARFSFAAAFEDYDDDGDQDLYVSNDFGRNNLYRNEGGRFADVAAEAGVLDVAAGMGVSWGDFDRDGRIDLYVSNMDSAAGSRMARQLGFQARAGPEERALFLRHARGNTLFRNLGGAFEDATLERGGARGGWAWGAIFVDFQNDGRLDLYVPNGMATHERADDLEDRFWREVIASSPLAGDADEAAKERYVDAWHRVNSLLRQGFSWHGRERNRAFVQADGRFVDASFALGLDQPDDGRAAARVDWDLDGDLDLLVTSRSGPRLRLLLNQSATREDFVAFRLAGSGANTAAVGARVELVVEGEGAPRFVESLRAGEGFLAQQSAWIHFGLGGARPREARVRWPDGSVERFAEIARGERYVLAQGSGRAERWAPPRAASALLPSDTTPPSAGGPARVVAVAPVPVPALAVRDEEGAAALLLGVDRVGEERFGPPRLFYLWTSADPAGGLGLAALEARRADFEAAGIELASLCTDAGERRDTARAELARAGWSSRAFEATTGAIAVLDVLHGALIDRETPLPLPSAFLFDARGRLVAAYVGGVEPATVFADRELLELGPAERRAAASPFAGRWNAPVAAAPLGYYQARFERRGLAQAAREYMLGRIQVVRANPADADVELAHAFARAGRYDEAADAFRRAVDADPDHFGARSGLGIALHTLRRYDEAAAAYRHALRLDPRHDATWFNLGLLCLATGERQAATISLERLFELESAFLEQLERAIALYDERARRR